MGLMGVMKGGLSLRLFEKVSDVTHFNAESDTDLNLWRSIAVDIRDDQ
jgi:hypothetical protein